MISKISIASIDTADRLRTLDPDWVTLLAEDIGANGLDEPIRVTVMGKGFKLVSGARRIAACLDLGWSEIDALVDSAPAPMSPPEIRLAEIKSHMLRGELTALDRAVTVSAWCDLYKAANGAPKRGPKSKLTVVDGASDEALEEFSVTMTVNWSDAAQRALQIGEKTLFRHLKIARLDASLRERIALLTIAKSQKDLLTLASQTPTRQHALVDLLAADPARAETVSEAIALLDQTAATVRPIAPYERVSEKFAKLDRRDQERFFALHADLIEAWMAKGRSSRKAA